MTPETAAYRLVCALALGAALGLLYGFLRPLRLKHTVLADGLFLLGVFWVWLYYNFALCGGDIRLGCCGGLLAGALSRVFTLRATFMLVSLSSFSGCLLYTLYIARRGGAQNSRASVISSEEE